jgi:hypothetical protein
VRQACVASRRKKQRKNLQKQHWHPVGVSETIRLFACGSGSWIAMRATLWLIGCALCIAGTSSVAAASLCAQDQDSASRAAADSTNPHDGGNSNNNGDALGLNRDGTARGSSGDTSSSTSSNNSGDHSGGATPAPTAAPGHLPRLGWQSLLPGSIQ